MAAERLFHLPFGRLVVANRDHSDIGQSRVPLPPQRIMFTMKRSVTKNLFAMNSVLKEPVKQYSDPRARGCNPSLADLNIA